MFLKGEDSCYAQRAEWVPSTGSPFVVDTVVVLKRCVIRRHTKTGGVQMRFIRVCRTAAVGMEVPQFCKSVLVRISSDGYECMEDWAAHPEGPGKLPRTGSIIFDLGRRDRISNTQHRAKDYYPYK